MKAKNYDDAEHQDTFNPFFMSTNNATAASIAHKMHHFEGIDLTHARLIEVWNLKRVRGPRARPDAGYGLLGLGAHALPAQHPTHTHTHQTGELFLMAKRRAATLPMRPQTSPN